MIAEKYVLYVDGIPQKELSDSIEILERVAENSYINGSNTVEIMTTSDFLLTHYYDNFKRHWIEIGH